MYNVGGLTCIKGKPEFGKEGLIKAIKEYPQFKKSKILLKDKVSLNKIWEIAEQLKLFIAQKINDSNDKMRDI